MKNKLLITLQLLILLLLSQEVKSSNQLNISLSSIDVSCFGGADGQITSQISGGISPYNYQWSNGASTMNLSGLLSGNFYLTVSDANGCSGVDSAFINQPTQISIQYTTDSVSCLGTHNGILNIDYSSTTGGVAPHVYSLDGINFQTGNYFGGLSAGYYDLYVSDAIGCIAEFNFEIGAPLAINTSVEVNNSTLVSNATEMGLSYQWLACDNGFLPIAGQTEQAYTANSIGNYAVEITQNNCIDTSACHFIGIVSIENESQAKDFKIFPNPTTGTLHIDFKAKQKEVTISLQNMLGEVLETKVLRNESSINYDLQRSSGIYYLRIITSENKQITEKILLIDTSKV